MEKVILFFETRVQTPEPWGIYHLCCMGILVVCVALLVAFGKKLRAAPKLVRRLTIGTGIFLIAIEALKQIFYGLHAGEDEIFWDYPWWVFPLQMCSTPMYVCFALLFFREGRIQRALCTYLGTFGMVGGIAVMLLPSTVFTDFLFVDLHTMIWHILLVCLGVLQWCGGTAGQKASDLLGCAAVFLLFAGIAAALDCALPQLAEEGFNMFYLSPYIPISMSDFVEWFWETVPYPVYLLTYALGFIGVSAAIFFPARAIRAAVMRCEERKEKTHGV